MRKQDLYNQLKQEQYKTDIESLRWRKWALKADNAQDREDYNRIADRDENEAMGIFKAQMAILPDFKGKLNEESRELLSTFLSMKGQVEDLQQQQEKEVA